MKEIRPPAAQISETQAGSTADQSVVSHFKSAVRDPGSPDVYYGRRAKSYGERLGELRKMQCSSSSQCSEFRLQAAALVIDSFRLKAELQNCFDLLQSETARYEISLITDLQQFVAHAREAQHVDSSTVALKIITSAGHGFSGLSKFVRDGSARQTPREGIVFTINVAGTEALFLILIAAGELFNIHSLVQRFFANAEIAVVAVAVDKFGVLMDFVRLVD